MNWFAILIIIVTTVCIIFYNETYQFWEEAVSNLGGVRTKDLNRLNIGCMILFILGFLGISYHSVNTGLEYLQSKHQFKNLKAILLFIISAGAFLICIPHDVHWIHGVGAFMFITGFGVLNFVLQELRYYGEKGPMDTNRIWDLFLVVMLFLLIISYFITVIIGGGIENVLQKLILITSIASILSLDNDDY